MDAQLIYFIPINACKHQLWIYSIRQTFSSFVFERGQIRIYWKLEG